MTTSLQSRSPSQIHVAAACALALLATLLSFASTSQASADVVWFWTEQGETGLAHGQSFSAVNVKDQSGNQDTWSNYVEFFSGTPLHQSVFLMEAEGSGDTLNIDLNYRGPSGIDSAWRMQLVDQTNQWWVPVWTNDDMPSWSWTSTTVTVADASRYINADGNVVVIWESLDGADATQLDYLQVRRSGTNPPPPTSGPELPSFSDNFDYQIGRERPVASNVGIISRDWHTGTADADAYNICYVNAFQTQPGNGDRIDTEANWPTGSVSPLLDTDWDEYVINIKTAASRRIAAAHVNKMIDGCADKGFDAVEFDNLDVWTRMGDSVDPDRRNTSYWFGKTETVAYAKMLVDYTHSVGLAAAQKNTAELFANNRHEAIGFDFAVVEECQQWNECSTFANAYDNKIIVIEYVWSRFRSVCRNYGSSFPVVKEDLAVRNKNQARSFC